MKSLCSIDDKESRLKLRASIDEYEAALKKEVGSDRGDMDEVNEKGLDEYLIGGAYTRALRIPKGHTIGSKLWLKPRLWIIISGKVRVRTELGDQNIMGPWIGEPPFGSKVALYAETEVLWAAITGANEVNSVEEAEKLIVAKDYSDFTYPWDKLEVMQ